MFAAAMGGKRALAIYVGVRGTYEHEGGAVVDWFRNSEWNDEIEAAFEAKLVRARSKAQYLNIQAYTLLASDPSVAASLARRAIGCADASQTARAGLYLGTALAIAGDLDGAIAALEGAIEAERHEPMYRTAAHLDQALLVALARRDDMYDLALERLGDERSSNLSDQSLSALIAQALIGSERGDNVAGLAAAALDGLGDSNGSSTGLPALFVTADLRCRLKAACNR